MTKAIQPKRNNKAIVAWLYGCAFMVFAMMIIGAITRLTESGLSMVEWRPLIGALPPMNDAEWLRVFELYQATPEYQKVNAWMGIEDFKTIFFWEWFHRLWGRLIGLIFALPLIVFWVRGMIPHGYKFKFLGLLFLGGLQGLMGWYMVKSGLIDRPDVSHYRLAAHLSLAFIILGALIWTALSLTLKTRRFENKNLFRHGVFTLLCVALTIIWGAYTAGLDAGLVYNETFPKMGGQWIPPDFWKYDTVWMNITENHSAVQFTHRWLAVFSVLIILSFWVHAYLKNIKLKILYSLAIIALLQMSLGIATILSGVHIHIAVTHQAGAAILFSLIITCLYVIKPYKTA